MYTGVLIDVLPELWVIDILSDIVLGVSTAVRLSISADVLVKVKIVAVTAVVLGLEFIVRVACALEVLTGAIISGASCIGAGVNTNGLAAVIPSPLEE